MNSNFNNKPPSFALGPFYLFRTLKVSQVQSKFSITLKIILSSLLLICFSPANAVLIKDDFSDGVIDSSKWITGGSDVTEHDGILDIQQNITDAGGWVKTVEFTPAKKLRLEIEHTMHTIPYEGWPWGSYYYFPHFAFESTQPEGSFAVQWHRSDYPSDYCNDENYHNKVSIGGFGGCYAASNLISSDYYDRKIKSVITYDSLTGDIKLDIGGDGTVDFSAVAPADKRFPIKQVHIGGYGWWTGHYHQIDSFKLESLDGAISAITSIVPKTVSFGDETALFTVKGTNLIPNMSFSLKDCDQIQEVGIGTATERFFQCTPKNNEGIQAGTVSLPDGTVLKKFSVNVYNSMFKFLNFSQPDPWKSHPAAL